MGSIHAFSIFVIPLEARFGAERSSVSFVYSLALLSLTAAVLISPRWYRHINPALLLGFAFVASVAALAVCAASSSLWVTTGAYGLVFGAANGVGYGLSLVLAAQALPHRRGFAMSLVTAIYAIGAAAAANVLVLLLDQVGLAAAFLGQMVLILICGVMALVLATMGGAHASSISVDSGDVGVRNSNRLLVVLWLTYGTAVASGLMVLGHASGIAVAQGANQYVAAGAVTLIAIGNAMGGVAVSRVADAWPMRRLMFAIPLLSSIGTVLLALGLGVETTLVGLSLVGLSYGAVIACYPAIIIRLFGIGNYPQVYGRVFTAWGAAGLGAPWLAGWLYELAGNYQSVLWLATIAAVASALIASRMRLQA